jgi:hypothetical protein
MMSLVLAILPTQLAPIDGRIDVTAQSDAKVALAYVRTSVSVTSINNPKDYKDFAGSSDERQRNLDLHNSRRTSMLAKYQGNSTMALDVVASAKAAIALRIGNCEAQAAVGYCFIVEKCQSAVWRAGLKGYDHAFLVVGPPVGAKYNDSSSWTDAIICDPWANEMYASSELTAKMKALFKATDGAGGIEEGDDRQRPHASSTHDYPATSFPKRSLPSRCSPSAFEVMRVAAGSLRCADRVPTEDEPRERLP